MNPISVIKEVPIVKYALGIAGVVAGIAIIKSQFK